MKVLKIKDRNDFTSLKFARGNNFIIPQPDGSGDLIIGLNVLDDPAFADLVEDILDKTELVDFVPHLDFDPSGEDTPTKEPKGDFSKIREQRKEQPIESIVEAYYESKKGFFTKVAEFLRLA